MTSADRLSVLPATERNALETLLMKFEQGWAPDLLPTYFERLESEASDVYRRLALIEMVKIDLQRGWTAGQGKKLEEYSEQFPLLGSLDTFDPELILVEFHARKSIDANLVLESYCERCPQQYDELVRLAAEGLNASQPSGINPTQASIETSRIGNIQDTQSPTPPVRTGLPVEFGRYRILRELGAGAMGSVHLAHDTQLDRQVALKTPSFQSDNKDEMVTRFYREARAAAQIQHRNICPIYDVGEINGQHFISMAFINGRMLSELIKPEKLAPPKTVAVLIHRLSLALVEAHRHNVIHRDLKPANIMIDKKREPVVMDFGLACQTDVESRMTQSGMLLGTPAYMSPEQLSGNPDDVGPQSDIFSLGVIFYELLTGKLPFSGTLAQVVSQILHVEPTPPTQIREAVSPELEAICASMMAKDRGERYQSMDDVATAIKNYVSGSKEQPSQGKPAGSNRSQTSSRTNPGESVSETGVLNEFFAAQAAGDPSQTSMESLPSQSPIPMAIPLKPSVVPTKPSVQLNPAQPQPAIEKGFFNGSTKWIAAGLAGLFLCAAGLGIVFYAQTPYGTIRIETLGEIDGLEVLVDGNTISLNESNPAEAADHELTLKLGGTELKLDSETNQFVLAENDNQRRISVSIKSVQLLSNEFTVGRNGETILKIELLPDEVIGSKPRAEFVETTKQPDRQPQLSRMAIQNMPFTPLPPGPAGEVLKLSGHSRFVCGLKFTPDGKYLVSNSEDRTIRLWDLANGEQRRVINCRQGARDLAVSPTDPWVAICGTYGHVEIFNWETGESVRVLSQGNGLYMGIDFSPDGNHVVATNLGNIGKRWNAQTGELLNEFAIKAPKNADCNVQFLPNGKQFLVAPSGSMVQLFDVEDCRHITDLNRGIRTPGRLTISPDGKRYISSGFDGSITIFDLEKREKTITTKIGRGENDVAWSPDGNWIAVSHGWETFIVDSRTLVPQKPFAHHGHLKAWPIAFSPDSRFLATALSRGRGDNEVNEIRVWRVNDEDSNSNGEASTMSPASTSLGPAKEPTADLRPPVFEGDASEKFEVPDSVSAEDKAEPTTNSDSVKSESATDDRAIAQVFIDLGCSVKIEGNARFLYRLPPGEIKVSGISVYEDSQVQDEHIPLLSKLPELESLHFYACPVTDDGYTALAQLPAAKLMHFTFSSLGDKGLASLTQVKQLESLVLFHTDVTDNALKCLGQMPSLTQLTMGVGSKTKHLQDHGPVFVSDDGLAHLANIENLRKLWVVGPDWTDRGVTHLSGLRQLGNLSLTSPKITDAAIPDLAAIAELRKIYLKTPLISDIALEELRQRLPADCSIIDKRGELSDDVDTP